VVHHVEEEIQEAVGAWSAIECAVAEWRLNAVLAKTLEELGTFGLNLEET
jgi:hypothetical protein